MIIISLASLHHLEIFESNVNRIAHLVNHDNSIINHELPTEDSLQVAENIDVTLSNSCASMK